MSVTIVYPEASRAVYLYGLFYSYNFENTSVNRRNEIDFAAYKIIQLQNVKTNNRIKNFIWKITAQLKSAQHEILVPFIYEQSLADTNNNFI